ncbi:hypothetical protein [Methanobrevibacter sp.]
MIEITPEIKKRFSELYMQDITIRRLKQTLKISNFDYQRLFRVCRKENSIIPRKRGRHKTKRHHKNKPKNYTLNRHTGTWRIQHAGTYYVTMKTKEQAVMMVDLLRANNWDKNMVPELKEQVQVKCPI